MSRVVYLNGRFVPEAEAKLSIYDLSVMQAAAAFEMTRSFHGKHFKLTEHLERLLTSCALLNIPLPEEFTHAEAVESLHALCYAVSDRNDHGPGEEHRLLVVVSPGCAPMYRDLAGVIPHPFLYIADFPLRYTVQGFSKYFTEGVHCVTSPIQQVPDACVPSQAKHRSRLHFHLAQQQAPAGTWPILTTEYTSHYGDSWYECAEAPGANIAYVINGEVFTIEANALPGISLQTVKHLAKTHECVGRDMRYLAQNVDELWLTGTPFCALSVTQLDGKPIGDGKIGPVYKAMMEKWNNLVGLNIAQQIIDWDRA